MEKLRKQLNKLIKEDWPHGLERLALESGVSRRMILYSTTGSNVSLDTIRSILDAISVETGVKYEIEIVVQ